MACEWTTARLSERYEFSSGLSKPRSEFGFGYCFLTFKDVLDNYFVPDALSALVNSTEKDRTSCSVKRGDVFLTRTSETQHELGMSCVALKDYESATFNGFTKRLRPKPNTNIVPEYAAYFFRGPQFRRDVTAMSSLSTRASLNNEMLTRLNIVLPPVEVQHAIGRILKTLDDKIELNRRMNETLEGLARAIFQSWFVDFDPVRAKLDGSPPAAFDPTTAALFPEHLEDSPLGKKPIGWLVTALDNVLAVLETGGRPKGGVGGITSGVPSIGAESIVSVGIFDFGKTKFVPVEFHEGMRKGHIQSHDVLLYKDGGRPGEYEPHVSMFGDGFPFEKCSINEHVYRLRTNERLSQEYLYFWMTSEFALAEMRIKGTGVAIPGLNSTAVRSLAVLVPPRPIVEAFTRQAAPLITRLLANAKQSRTLAAIRDALLPKLLSGEIRVAEGERLVEEANSTTNTHF
ncbi:MAG: restriction endonuclease subunit S [Planctomycetaceae bacterium]